MIVLSVPHLSAAEGSASSVDHVAGYVFLGIAVIVIVARVMGRVAVRLRQPAVVGEILAGIALGPSLLGLLPGDPSRLLFPEEVRPFLSVIAQLGLIIFMFIVGLELDLDLVKGKERAAATISIASVLLPFGLGIGLAVWLHRNHGVVEGEPVPGLAFALFIGASMSVTAFPVLARILTDRGMHRTQTGVLALACAAVDDVLAWSLLAVVLAVVSAGSLLGLPLILLESVAFVAVMFLVVKPRLRALVSAHREAGRLTPDLLAVVIVGFLLSAWTTEQIGIHAIFGAFLFGVIMPRKDSRELFAAILDKLEQVSVLLLLPVFFIATGLNVDLRGLGAEHLLELLAVLGVAIAGKFVGASAAARLMGTRSRRAMAVGVLMNTRGLTELVILNVGLQAGVLDRDLFTILVVMAVVTTVMTEPLLRLVYPDKLLARDVAEAERAALDLAPAYRVVTVVGDDAVSADVVDVGTGLLGGEEPAELVITRVDPPAQRVELGAGLLGDLNALTASFEYVHALVHRAEERGVCAKASTRISDVPARDLVAQATAVDAHVLVLPVDRNRCDVAEQVLREAECAVALHLPAEGSTDGTGDAGSLPRRVVVDPGSGDDASAALEQALRLSLRTHVPVVVVDDGGRGARKAAAAAGQAARLGLPVTVVPRHGHVPAPDDLLVAGLCQGRAEDLAAVLSRRVHAPHPSLLVRAPVDDRGESLHALLDRLAETRPAAAVAEVVLPGQPLPL